MPRIRQFSNLPHPDFGLLKIHTSLGQFHFANLSVGKDNLLFFKLKFRPLLPDTLSIGVTGNPLIPHFLEKSRTIAFPVKHQAKAKYQTISIQLLLGWLLWYVLQQPWHY